MSFALDMSKFTAKTDKQLSQIVRKTAFGLFSAVMKGTPVDSGRARGAWMFSINKFDDTAPTNVRSDGEVQTEILSGVAQYKAGDVLTLSNNVDYIERLEYGWSKQAPTGMVRVNIMRFQQFVDQASKGIK